MCMGALGLATALVTLRPALNRRMIEFGEFALGNVGFEEQPNLCGQCRFSEVCYGRS
jgi:hypothetical protein